MTTLGCSTTIRCLFFGVLVLAATSWAQTRPPIAEQMAKTYGLDAFGQNDQYWLLFPLHVAWDGNATVTDEGMHKLPLGEGSAERVVVKYPSEGGYAPGDTWELYVGADHRVEAFIYHGGGPGIQKRPSVLIATWAGYKQAGPLLISTDHQGTADGKPMRVFFSDVSVKLVGSDTWVNAE
jgi:hypothetical protein